MVAGTYSDNCKVPSIAKDVIGIREGFKTFATMHILNTPQGLFFLSDTMINTMPTEEELIDIARLTRVAVEYYTFDPVMAMLSYSNFGSNIDCPLTASVHNAVAQMHKRYPELLIDGEMQLDVALDKNRRDKIYPFNKLMGKDVNTLIFPSLDAASSTYKMILKMGAAESIGPIAIGLNKAVHFISVEAPVREIVNMATVASLDSAVFMKAGNCRLDR